MKPIPFSSFGVYRRFSRHWWADLFKYVIIGWFKDIQIYWHRARYGWAPRDTWNLDYYLNRVLGASLAHLSKHTHGTPSGYPYKTPRLGPSPNQEDWRMVIDATNHEHYAQDLLRWSDAFLDLYAWEDGGMKEACEANVMLHGLENWSEIHKIEQEKYRRVEKTLKEMAPWWGGLWD